jgi:hypothetical protein
VTITRRSLLTSLGVALPATLVAAGAEAATVPTLHHHKKRHTHSASAHQHRRKGHHTTAAISQPRTQA